MCPTRGDRIIMRKYVKTSVKLNFNKPLDEIENSIAIALRMLMEETHRQAEPVTPKKYGGLRASVTKQMTSKTTGIMRWAVPYASVQEEGMRRNPRTGEMIIFSNYTTPGTHAGYIQEGIEKAIPKLAYFLQVGGLE